MGDTQPEWMKSFLQQVLPPKGVVPSFPLLITIPRALQQANHLVYQSVQSLWKIFEWKDLKDILYCFFWNTLLYKLQQTNVYNALMFNAWISQLCSIIEKLSEPLFLQKKITRVNHNSLKPNINLKHGKKWQRWMALQTLYFKVWKVKCIKSNMMCKKGNQSTINPFLLDMWHQIMRVRERQLILIYLWS